MAAQNMCSPGHDDAVITGCGRRLSMPGVRVRPAVLLLLMGLLLMAACSPAPSPGSATPAIERILDRRAAAVLHRNEAAYLAVVDPAAATLRAAERREFQNLAAVPLRSWEYRITDVQRFGDRATASADLRYRIAGYDTVPVSTPRRLRLDERHGRWYITADRPGPGGAQQLWQQGTVRVVRGTHSLVLGVLGAGQNDDRLRSIAAVADRAVPAVDAVWPAGWAHRVVLLVPGSLNAMAALLGAPAGSYQDVAAVTTGETGGGAAPADRIIINPEGYGELSDFGQRVVLTHETTHVATRSATSAATPLWLSEGFADWAGYRNSGRTAAEIAPELGQAVRRGELPGALPQDDDFAFGNDAGRLARAYEGGWLACEMIAGQWGEARLTAFYRAVGVVSEGDRGVRPGAIEKAMRKVLSTTPAAFTARWRAYLKQRLS